MFTHEFCITAHGNETEVSTVIVIWNLVSIGAVYNETITLETHL